MKNAADIVVQNIEGAETFFNQQLNIQPQYILLILSKNDWKQFAHPQAVYGMPHF